MGLPSFITLDIEEWVKEFKFSTTIRTRFSETDAFGHINNVSFFSYFEQARLDYFAALNLFNELNLSQLEQPMENLIVTANLECHYLAQLYYNQNINICVKTSSIGKSSFELQYCILEEESKNLIAIGRGSIVYINRKTGKSEPLSEIVKNKLIDFEKSSQSV